MGLGSFKGLLKLKGSLKGISSNFGVVGFLVPGFLRA